MALTFTPASMPGLSPAYALNPNPTFSNWPVAPGTIGLPPSWGNWSNAGATAKGIDGAGVTVAQTFGAIGADVGLQINIPTFPGAGWYVLDAKIQLAAGALTGAGVFADFFTDGSFVAQSGDSQLLSFSAAPDISGVARNTGVVGQTYAWRLLFQVKSATSQAAIVYAMAHWTSLGSEAAANQINWYQCSVRPATFAEIADGNAQYGLPVFPVLPGQAIAVSKAPRWSTKVKRAASGRERRTALWPYPLWQFELSYEVIRQRPSNNELAAMWEFFNMVQGQYAPFLFLDPTDYQSPNAIAAGPAGFGTGDGSTRTFQISHYLGAPTASGYPGILEPVYAPFGANIYINGTLQSAGYAFSANGLITFSTAPAPGAVLTWDGYFYFGCRFLQDDLSFEQLVSQLWSGKSVKFTSLRV